MLNIKKSVLSWLLHHANRYEKNKHFYSIKSNVLKKYGELVGYDVQEIEGKKCYSCNGTGIYIGYNEIIFKDTCWNCTGGWYKRPEWNTLQVYRFGNYSFHIPHERLYYKPEIKTVINGYIQHKSSYWSHFARIMIFLLFDFGGYRKTWHTGLGYGWRCNMLHSPKNFINNIIHLIRKGPNAIPFSIYRQRLRAKNYKPITDIDTDDLPF